jgi:hypothetical protein
MAIEKSLPGGSLFLPGNRIHPADAMEGREAWRQVMSDQPVLLVGVWGSPEQSYRPRLL